MLAACSATGLNGEKSMPPHRPSSAWSRLVAVAREAASDEEYIFVPYGFSAEVVNRALAQAPSMVRLTEAYAGRALAAAWMLVAWSVLTNYDHLIDFIIEAI